MGKHAAPDGTSPHPLVAAAMSGRAADGQPAHASGAARDEQSSGTGGLGWPEPPAPGGGRVGWPGTGPATDAAEVDVDPEGGGPRRGWRRFFRLNSAA